MKNKQDSQGFALLIAIIIAGVVITIGLVILDISIKTVSLSTNAVSSEIAFHAANAGIECVRYWRNDPVQRLNFRSPSGVAFNCFGQTFSASETGLIANVNSGAGQVFTHEFEVTHGGRCSQGTVVTLVSGAAGTDLAEIDNTVATGNFPWNSGTLTCPERGVCTVAYVRGYSTSCSNVQSGQAGRFTQREILLQL